MGTVRIPRTSRNRRESTYAQLIRRVNHRGWRTFEGRHFRPGASVDETDLRPAHDWPQIPLLIEYAGTDGTGYANRAKKGNDIHILWKFVAGEWIEIARMKSQGPEWWLNMKPIVLREIRTGPVDFVEVASQVSIRVLALLDYELEGLEDEARDRAMSFVYDQFSARLVDEATASQAA